MSNLNGGLSGSGTLRGTLGGGGVPAQDVYWDDILNKPNFATVATSGSYNDLTDKPTIPAAQVNADWNATSGVAEILNKPTIPAAQVNADWNATSGVAEILNKPTLAPVATSGSYNDLTNTPTIPAAQVNADWNATSGVAEILNKPTIPAAQVNADWNAASGVAEILNKPTIPTTASQIEYDNTTSGLQADDVQGAITELKSNLNEKSNLLDIVEINRSSQFSLDAGQASSVEWNVAREGYTPLGIVGLLGSGTSGVAFQDHYINGTKAYFYLRNVTSSRVVISNLRVRILYVKNS